MELDEISQEVILDHSRRPRHFGELADADCHVRGVNPACSDEVTLHVKFKGDTVDAVTFTGSGCAICMASASMLTLKITHRSRGEAGELSRAFHELLTASQEPVVDKRLGDLALLRGVRKFPQRVKCATLAWHALDQALAESSATGNQREKEKSE